MMFMMGFSLRTRASPYLLAILVVLPHLLVCSAAPSSEKDESKAAPEKTQAAAESPKKEDAQIIAISKRQTYANPINSVSGSVRDLGNSRNSYPSSGGGSYGFQYSGPPSTLGLSSYPTSGSLGSYNNINDNYRGGGVGGSLGYVGTGPRNERDYYPSSSSYSGPSYSTGGVGSSIGRNNYNNYNYNDRLDTRYPYDDYRYNTGYQRDRDALGSVNQEFAVRHGQLRHEEYQKRTGQGGPDYYDPFYFIGMRNGPNGINGNQPDRNSIDRHNAFLDRPSGFSPSASIPPTSPLGTATNVASSPVGGTVGGSSSSGDNNSNNNNNNNGGGGTVGTSPAAPLRNRRNSHQRPGDFYNEINNGDKYDIMTAKSAYPPSGHHNHHNHFNGNNNNHRLANYHHMVGSNSNQFLTREQLLRNPDMRVPYQGNHVDHYSSSSPGGAGLPWSVRIGTQLKVNDDGRSPNPNRFYVRDEMNPQKSRSRYPIYRRK